MTQLQTPTKYRNNEGNQVYKVQVGNSDFHIDLLFYHRDLRCLATFELKADKFKPEHLGQLNFYLEALIGT
ncbi:PDDEXK nuclease domain-containing protein [Hufsiella ginkgonis]|uniref:PDDEXK nuclease domain-containing protein n=1 Tax=Hufsiella ginkgonis TaxID=2695274 RepID=UPI0019256DA9